MRFHQFQNTRGGLVAIDLDAVWGVCPLGGNETTIYAGGGCFSVKGAVEDVLALISPAAAPDTFEEEIRERKSTIANALRDGERRIRLDELERIREEIKRARFYAAIGNARPSWLEDHITRRRDEIEQGA